MTNNLFIQNTPTSSNFLILIRKGFCKQSKKQLPFHESHLKVKESQASISRAYSLQKNFNSDIINLQSKTRSTQCAFLAFPPVLSQPVLNAIEVIRGAHPSRYHLRVAQEQYVLVRSCSLLGHEVCHRQPSATGR